LKQNVGIDVGKKELKVCLSEMSCEHEIEIQEQPVPCQKWNWRASGESNADNAQATDPRKRKTGKSSNRLQEQFAQL
jgi:hypothetical protein